MMMPRTPGSYDVSLTLNGRSTSPAPPPITSRPAAVSSIDSVTATTITGGLNITYNGDNTVNGQFQATICPP